MASRADEVVTADCIETFQRDGAVVLRGLLTPGEVEVLKQGIEKNLANPTSNRIVASNKEDPGLFVEDFRIYPQIDEYVATVERTAVGRAAALLMGCSIVRFHHDHLLVKEPDNISGSQNVSFWIPVDRVPAESSLRFVAGSHRDGTMYMPRTFLTNEARWWPEGSLPELPSLPPVPLSLEGKTSHDADAHIVQWAVNPGDAVAFHMLTVHSAAGTVGLGSRRRAYSIRVVGDDARHAPRRWKTSPPFVGLDLELPSGVPFEHPLFPIIWPPSRKGAISSRL